MQNLLLESDLAKLETSGLEIGHQKTIKKDDLVDIELFDQDIRRQSRKMADFYALYYCLENSVRRLITERMTEKYGAKWWDKVPSAIATEVTEKQKREKDTVLTVRSEDPLAYTNFGELIVIMESNWDCFSDTIRSKKAMNKVLSEFNQIRNVIAHSSDLSDNDILRFKLLVNDWFNIQS
jgi:hypothetical protein